MSGESFLRCSLVLRGHQLSLIEWGDRAAEPVVLLHGWMDVAASFHFIAEAVQARAPGHYRLLALDQRGYGESDWTREPAGGYWFPEYLADLDAVLTHECPDRAVHLVGHSLGGNVACLYAGLRPERVASLISLDGFGLPNAAPEGAAKRYRRWLDAIHERQRLASYDSLAAVADRLQKNNPRLVRERAEWIARHWAHEGTDGRWHLRADPAHKLPFPTGYRLDEAMAIWREVSAPTLWIGGSASEAMQWVGYTPDTRVPQPGETVAPGSFAARLACFRNIRFIVLEGAGHMLHHEQPEEVARLMVEHWQRSAASWPAA